MAFKCSLVPYPAFLSQAYFLNFFDNFVINLSLATFAIIDAAEISGASKSRQFFSITLPLLKPTLLFVLVINTIKSFQVFIEVYVMTKGGPMGATTTLVYLVFENAFSHTDMLGYASAIAYVLFGILIVLSLIQMKLIKPEEA